MNNDKLEKKTINNEEVDIDEKVLKEMKDVVANSDIVKREKESKKKRKIFNLDLIKGEIVNFFNFKRNVILFSIMVTLSFIVLFTAYLGIASWENKQLMKQKMEYAEKVVHINKVLLKTKNEAKKIFDFQKKINVAEEYLNSHVYRNNFFEFLENNILEDVYFVNYKEEGGGDYVFSAVATSVDAARAQVELFLKSEYVVSASVSNVSMNKPTIESDSEEVIKKNIDSDEVKFDIFVNIKSEIFNKGYKYDKLTRTR